MKQKLLEMVHFFKNKLIEIQPCVHVCMSACILSVCLPVCLSVCLSVCQKEFSDFFHAYHFQFPCIHFGELKTLQQVKSSKCHEKLQILIATPSVGLWKLGRLVDFSKRGQLLLKLGVNTHFYYS